MDTKIQPPAGSDRSSVAVEHKPGTGVYGVKEASATLNGGEPGTLTVLPLEGEEVERDSISETQRSPSLNTETSTTDSGVSNASSLTSDYTGHDTLLIPAAVNPGANSESLGSFHLENRENGCVRVDGRNMGLENVYSNLEDRCSSHNPSEKDESELEASTTG